MRMIHLFLSIAILFSCDPTEGEVTPMNPVEVQPETYLALGDSYTIGQSVEEKFRWPNILQDSLELRGIDYLEPQIIAKTGWRTDQLKEAAVAGAPGTGYGLVSLLIGVNNQFQGRSSSEYAVEFEDLLKFVIEKAGGRKERVIVLSIPDYGCTPFGSSRAEQIGKAIDEFNAINKEITDRYEVLYFDITPISREGKDDPSLVASDNLHPSGEQYGRWVTEVMKSSEFLENLAR